MSDGKNHKFGYEMVEHTADIALRVNAEILPEIYQFAAMGLCDLLVGIDHVSTSYSERIEVQGNDLEDLLVRMLSELIFRFSTRHLIFRQFIIEYLNHEKLILLAQGEAFDSTRHPLQQEIKAATYHGLEIQPTDDGFTATVVFDV